MALPAQWRGSPECWREHAEQVGRSWPLAGRTAAGAAHCSYVSARDPRHPRASRTSRTRRVVVAVDAGPGSAAFPAVAPPGPSSQSRPRRHRPAHLPSRGCDRRARVFPSMSARRQVIAQPSAARRSLYRRAREGPRAVRHRRQRRASSRRCSPTRGGWAGCEGDRRRCRARTVRRDLDRLEKLECRCTSYAGTVNARVGEAVGAAELLPTTSSPSPPRSPPGARSGPCVACPGAATVELDDALYCHASPASRRRDAHPPVDAEAVGARARGIELAWWSAATPISRTTAWSERRASSTPGASGCPTKATVRRAGCG